MKKNFFLIILLHFVVSCAPLAQIQDKNERLAYLPQAADQTLLYKHLPVFIIENKSKSYNRIGTAKAELTSDGGERVYVDPREATVYTDERNFKTANDAYTNLLYRIHFSETPYGLFPFQIAAGKNVGLLVIVTLNSYNQPVLYTLVHTCGCYLALIPTTHLSHKAYPPDWPEKEQVIYSEILPALLDPRDKSGKHLQLTILIRDASHRIKDVWVSGRHKVEALETASYRILPFPALENLPLHGSDRITSFYETSGSRAGHVKDSCKPLERLLISWWAFDWNIGEDKKLSADKNEPPVFFTSLKPWAREASDMRDFPTFLSYWGWRL